MASRATSLWLWVALVVLGGGLLAVASTVPNVPPGAQPLPIDSRRCDPVGDEQRYLVSTGAEWVAYYAHGTVCLDEARYADAIPELERAVALNATPRTLVALGVAYDGVGRFREASDRWHEARQLDSSRYPDRRAYYDHPMGLESALLDGRYAEALIILERYFTPHVERMPVGGNARVAPYNILQFDDLGLTQPFSDALHVAAQGDPQRGAELISPLYRKGGRFFGELRYARAIMLLAIGRRDEARFELHLAARLNSVYPHDSGPYQFQWSALVILERLAQE